MKEIRWFILFAFVAIGFGVYNAVSSHNRQKNYFDKLDLRLTGVVESLDLSYLPNGFGVVKVKILQANKNFYDPRKDLKYYYCLIKNGYAEFYQHGLYNCEIGDTVDVNTRKRVFVIKNGSKTDVEDISLLMFDEFYDYVKKKHQKF
jgi:hypothetical protein